MGATGALIMALAKRRLNWPLLRQAMDSTAKLSSFVIFILIGASVFTLTFRGVNGDLWVESLLTSLPGGQIGFLVVVNLDGLRAGVLSRLFRAGLHRHPAAAPVADKLGIDLIWFGVLLGDQHADLVPAPAVRFRAVLFPQRRADPRDDRPRDRPADRAGDHGADLLGQRSRLSSFSWSMVAMVIGFPGLVLSSLDQRPEGRPEQDPDRGAADLPHEIPQIQFK